MKIIDADALIERMRAEVKKDIKGSVKNAYSWAISIVHDMPTASEWIPIKTRPITEEEKEYFEVPIGEMYDCPLPEDGQEVLITTRHGEVTTDTFICDGSCGSYFETYDDDGDVLAWMPLPEKFSN